MKKSINLTRMFFLVFFSSLLLVSCGTEEDASDELLELTISQSSVPRGTPVSFQVSSSIAGDVTSQAVFHVNGTPISGNTFTPTVANESNEVYATFNGNTTATKTFASVETTPSEYTQKVLIEDYTGTWCGWCPRMMTIIQYFTNYSENIIPVAIHTPGTPVDPWLYEHAIQMMSSSYYDTGGAPAGQINRIHKIDQDKDATPCPNNFSFFQNQIDPYLNQNALLGLSIDSSLSGNSLSMNVKVGFASSDISNAKLIVYLIEDGLTYNQYNYFSGSTTVSCDPNFNYANMPHPIPNHPQEHILLKTYTDIYGDDIPQNQISQGTVWNWEQTFSLPANVTNANNLHIVAFVVGNGNEIKTRAALNVQRAKVGTFQDFD